MSPSESQNARPPVVARLKAATPWVAAFGLLWVLIAQLFLSFPVLYDTDSYFHLSIGRVYADHGVVDSLPWARFSAMHEGFGDKEVLFHLLLVPFAGGESPEIGARWALGFWNALVIVTLAFLGFRLSGRWGLLAPLLVYAGSYDFLNRLIRLRPETLALLLFLAAAVCVGRGRYRLLGLVTFLFTLSYTAFHALVGLCFLWFVQLVQIRGKLRWELVIYPVLGAGLALLLHPHFPHNLVIWKIQSLDFFQQKAVLDVGEEIQAQPTDVVLFYNLPWLIALAGLWMARRRPTEKGNREEANRDLRNALLLGAAVFGGLYLLMLRFSTHFMPFATLAMLAWVGRPKNWIQLPGRGRIPLALVLTLALAPGSWRAGDLLTQLSAEPPQGSKEAEWRAFGQSIPNAAKVAATWGNAQTYMFFAPHASYLNVLDPVFMATPYPEAYATQRAIFDGEEPDVPLKLAEVLDSDFLAASRTHKAPELFERLRHDPRIKARYQQQTLLFQLQPEKNQSFVLDWRQVPRRTNLPVSLSVSSESWRAYPLRDRPKLQALEGYVDVNRLSDEKCVALVHDWQSAKPRNRNWEIAPYGPTTLWLDGRPMVSTQATLGAYLGRGLSFGARVEPGNHRITVLTCRGEPIGEAPSEYSGFFLMDRSR